MKYFLERLLKKSAHPCFELKSVPALVVLLESAQLPTTDYYLMPYWHDLGVNVVRINVNETHKSMSAHFPANTLFLFVRCVDKGWLDRIMHLNVMEKCVALFIDDDILDKKTWHDAEPAYRKRMRASCELNEYAIRNFGLKLFVSNVYLANKYSQFDPVKIAPRYIRPDNFAGSPCNIFYHGTSIHRHEAEWIQPIVSEVIYLRKNVYFEIFGDGKLNKIYKNTPRVSVLHPMGWRNYFEYTASRKYHIGLVPLLPDITNNARSHTKFFDIVRMGAVGVYSDVSPYKDYVSNGVDGVLLENNPSLWVDAILKLSDDLAWRDFLHKNSLEKTANP